MTSESRNETIEPNLGLDAAKESTANDDLAGESTSPDVDNSAFPQVGSGLNFP
jgi:hypothetical protein